VVHAVGPGGFDLALSPENGRRALKARSGKVILGARHSTITLAKEAEPNAVPGRVYTAEPTGDITYAHVRIGEPVVTVSVEPHVRVAPDEPVWLGFDQLKLHLFDGDTQQTLAD
jgi:multiple sugar transport system ATP-binding protein